MPKRRVLAAASIAFLVVIGVAGWYFAHHPVAVLQPEGIVGAKERNLLLITVGLGLLIIIPVFAMTFGIAWRYREGNTSARYTPNWDHSRLAETIWWLIPSVIITILAVITWHSSHELDPFKPLASTTKPLTIQVVALDWKWLFIYPEQHIATVNYLRFPEQTPLNFQITADAPMNSFWIPRLGGQVYAMSGMSTQLHLMADGVGSYSGSSANISGKGFAGMRFTATSTTEHDFRKWVNSVKQAPQQLDETTYAKLVAPSENHPRAQYSSSEPFLYDQIVMKYMEPGQLATGFPRVQSLPNGGRP